MASAEDYRRYAGECLRLAQESDNSREKALLLEMAEMWRRLAERANDATKHPKLDDLGK